MKNIIKYIQYGLVFLTLNTILFATVYENSESGGTEKWSIYHNRSNGATINNIYDDEIESNVIEFKGDGKKNYYMIGAKKGVNAWKNSREKVVKWKMKFSKRFKISLYVDTKFGRRVFIYTPNNSSLGKYQKRYIRIGLGENTIEGKWITIQRDIEKDLKKFEPNNRILNLNSFKVQGSGYLDDLELISNQFHPKPCTKEYRPVCAMIDLCKGDKICPAVMPYQQTFANLCMMKNNPNARFLYQGKCRPSLINVKKIYENGEDGETSRWKVLSKTGSVHNIYDAQKRSRVIEFKGEGRKSAYRIGARLKNSPNSWNNSSPIFSWSMQIKEKYRITIYVETRKGSRRFFITYKNLNKGLFSQRYIGIGLGQKSMNGQWQNFSVDLATEIQRVEPDNKLISISGVKIQGSGRFDNLVLHRGDYVNPPIVPHYCTQEYTPLCASVQIECFTTPCEAKKVTFSNLCMMKQNPKARFLYKGECRIEIDQTKADAIKYAKLWDSKAINDYSFVFNARFFGPPQPEVKVTVRGGNVVSVVNTFSHKKMDIKNVRSINDYFTLIKDYIKDSRKRVSVTYNKEFGYPTHISLDLSDKRVMDAGISYVITNFQVEED